MELSGISKLIFLDRYSKKGKREDIKVGDTVVVLTKEDPRWPTKEVGVVESIEGDIAKCRLEESGELFEQEINKLDLPLELTPDEMWDRWADAIAEQEVESGGVGKVWYWRDEFRWLFDNFRFSPGGRIQTMLGANRELTAYNCFVIPSPVDSRHGIIETLRQKVEIMSRGGGVGINVSTLRPRYSYVRKVNGTSSGAVSWANLYSTSTNLVEQAGSRRGALMIILNDFHPDILEFIEAKKNPDMLNFCNISVGISDDFMDAVFNDKEWHLEFPDYEAVPEEVYHNEWNGNLKRWKDKGYPVRRYKTVRAREIWDKIIESAHASAEPGVVFLERYNKFSNIWYLDDIICTNPCNLLNCMAS